MSPQRIAVNTWIRHEQYGVGQVMEPDGRTHAKDTMVFFPRTPHTPPKRRRVPTRDLTILKGKS